MTSSEVAVSDPAVPDLVDTPTAATSITASDIAIPTLYIGQKAGRQFDAGNVKVADVYAAQNADDPEPVVLWEFGSDDPGVLILPLGVYKSWAKREGDRLSTWPFEAEHPDDAYVVYNYVLSLPEVDPSMPYKLRLYRASAPAAQRINLGLAQGADAGEVPYARGYRLSALRSERPQLHGRAVVISTTPSKKQLDAAADLAKLVGPVRPPVRSVQADQPTI